MFELFGFGCRQAEHPSGAGPSVRPSVGFTTVQYLKCEVKYERKRRTPRRPTKPRVERRSTDLVRAVAKFVGRFPNFLLRRFRSCTPSIIMYRTRCFTCCVSSTKYTHSRTPTYHSWFCHVRGTKTKPQSRTSVRSPVPSLGASSTTSST